MSLSNVEQVRLRIGDTDEDNYILSDNQVDFYLTTNNDDVDAAVNDASIAVAQILAIRSVSIRTEDLWEDNRSASKRYNESLEKTAMLKGNSAYPIIGGGTYKGTVINQFDEDNDYDKGDTFYNSCEDI